jgi:hypothetical protein
VRRGLAPIIAGVGLVLGAGALRGAPLYYFGLEWDTLAAPRLDRITVAGDTIWLSGTEGTRDVAYFLVRPGMRWTRVDGAMRAVSMGAPALPSDSVHELEGGARLRIPRGRSEADTSAAMLTLADGRSIPLRADVPAAVRAGLADPEWYSEGTDAELRFAPVSSSRLTTPRAYWFGLAGGFSEGFGALGGLLRVDRATGRLATIAHPWLGDVTITSMVAVGDTLFLGTMREGEYAPWGTEGLIRYEPGRDRWQRDTTGPGALPDLLIWSVARVGDSLAVATGTGAAIRSLAGGPWTSWHFKPEINDTAVSIALVPAADTATRIELVTRYLWQEHLITRPAEFARRFGGLGADRQVELGSASSGIRALNDTLFIPELVAALRNSAHQYERAEITAQLAAMHHPLATFAMRVGPTDADPLASITAAIRLLAGGDAATRDLVARRLQGTPDEFQWALAVVVGAHDDRWLPALVRRASQADEALRANLYGALAQLGTPAAVRQLFAFAEGDRLARRTLFAARGDSVVVGATTWSRADSARAARAIVLALADPDTGFPRAIALAARLRVGPAIPRLIDQLRRRAAAREGSYYDVRARSEMLEVTRALVSLTGQRGAPVDAAEGMQYGARAAAFWERWRASAGAALVQAVPVAAGAAALASLPSAGAFVQRPYVPPPDLVAFSRAESARAREARAAGMAAGLRVRRRAAPGGWSTLRP